MDTVTFGDLGGSADLDLDDLSSFFEKTASGLVQDALAGLTEMEPTPSIVIDAPEDVPTNSVNGANSANGINGINGTNDTNSANGTNGANGAIGANETNSTNGTNDTKGTSGTGSTTGPNVTNGTEKPAAAAVTTTAPAAPKIDLMTDYKELEALVAESTSNYVKTTLNGLSPVPYQPTVPTSTGKYSKFSIRVRLANQYIAESMAAQNNPYLSHLHQHQAHHSYYTYTQQPIPEPPQQQPASGENLPPNQTCPSAILYDKARQAALSKSSAHTRREGLHSTRRPWTQEEEKALMAGLDMVKGPHWSQILTLFGQNGTISDILKDRTQVQLKDKARNLKLFFLKTNSEMPYYLQAVTGELKTRAPTQAARKEAEERARLNSEEDQAKLQGIMTLAGGLQHLSQVRPATGSTGMGSGVVTPAQAASAAQAAQGRAATGVANIPRTVAATFAQARPGLHPTTQQTSQAMAQHNPQRPQGPQTQLPPHVPRPQSQQVQHHLPQQQGQQQRPPQQQVPQQAQQQHIPQPLSAGQQQAHLGRQSQQPKPLVPQYPIQQAVPPPPHPIALPATTPHHSASHTPSATASPIPAQMSQPHTPVHSHTPPLPHPPVLQHGTPTGHASPFAEVKVEPPKPVEPLSPAAQQEADNAAEAALLEGLQAAVAEALG